MRKELKADHVALPYEILLQHVSIVPCLCVFGISHFGLYYLYSSTTFTSGKSNLPKTGSLSLGSRGQTRFCSLAAFSTLLTVVLDALQLRAMLVWLRFNPASRMISRYLVIMVTSFVMNLRCKAYEFIIKKTVPSDRNLGIRFPESRYRLKRNSGTVAPERRFRIARNTQLHLLSI